MYFNSEVKLFELFKLKKNWKFFELFKLKKIAIKLSKSRKSFWNLIYVSTL